MGSMANRRQFLKSGGMAGLLALVLPRLVKAEAPIPADMKMYEVAGQTIFPVYDGIGPISRKVCAFPYVMQGKKMIFMGYWVDGITLQQANYEEYSVRIRHDSMAMLATALRNGDPIIDRGEGDMMPEHGQVARFTPRKYGR
jgi:hypothetical protein